MPLRTGTFRTDKYQNDNSVSLYPKRGFSEDRQRRLPRLSPGDSLTDDDVPGIDASGPLYWGEDRSGRPWIGERSSYLSPDARRVFDAVGRLDESAAVEIVRTDADSGRVLGATYEAFSEERFKRALSEGILHFVYRKVAGGEREAYGTTKIDVLVQNGCRMAFGRRRDPRTSVRYYDMERRGWRSFRTGNLLRIYEPEDAD